MLNDAHVRAYLANAGWSQGWINASAARYLTAISYILLRR
jgi:hypothetical protein